TAIVVCDHGIVKRPGVRAGAGRRGHLPAPAGLECESPANPSAPEGTRPGLCSAVEPSVSLTSVSNCMVLYIPLNRSDFPPAPCSFRCFAEGPASVGTNIRRDVARYLAIAREAMFSTREAH